MIGTHIAGGGWKVYVDQEYGLWRGEGRGFEVPLKMLLGHIPGEKIANYLESTLEYGRMYGMMYPDAAEFLNSWGVKCSVENLEPIVHEELQLPPRD